MITRKMKKSLLSILITCIFVCVTLLSSCDDGCGCQPPPESEPHPWLSQYGFFQGDLKDLNPKEKVIPYDLINPLFSDYAEKDRFVYVPEGMVTYRSKGVLEFPVGSVLIKNFSYTLPSGEKYRVETRLLRKTDTGWDANAYFWNSQQTDAQLTVVGATVELTFKNDQDELIEIDYLVPNKNQCKTCHSISGEIELIGPTGRNLNFITNQGFNQLEVWETAGILSDLPDLSQVPEVISAFDETADIAARARAYLDINCAHCHNPAGSARNSGFFLHLEETDPYALGFWKLPVSAGPGTGGHKYVIEPGSATTSILWYRMNSTLGDIRMPELSRTLIHKEGVELIEAWIDSL